jgi:phosphate/sulfate permease
MHTITGSIMGVGATQRLSRRPVGRGRAHRVGMDLTIPLSGAVAALTWLLLPHG